MKSFEQLIFVAYVVVYMGLMYYSTTYSMQIETDRLMQLQQIDIDSAMKEDSLIVESAKYRGFIKHDGDPKTNKYDLKLDAGGTIDTENDEMNYKWVQISGKDLELKNNNSNIIYLQAPAGEYSFKLDVTDSYGVVSSDSQTVVIGEEPNVPPAASFSIANESPAVYYKNGPSWQAKPDSVQDFQKKHKLEVDGLWGPASQTQFEAIAKEKANKKANKKANQKTAKEKAKQEAAKEKRAKDLKVYNDKLNKIESEISEIENSAGFFGLSGAQNNKIKELNNEKKELEKTRLK